MTADQAGNDAGDVQRDHFAYDEDMIGKWVAMHCLKCQYVYTFGDSAVEVRDAALALNVTDPIIWRVPRPGLRFYRVGAA